MKLLSKLGALFALACVAVPFGCSNDTAATNTKDGSSPKDSSSPDGGGLTCGATKCPPRMGIGIERITQCCTDKNECGLMFPGAKSCLLPDAPGVLSRPCGDYAVPDQTLTLTGCCGPNGCGKNDAFLGCIVNTDLGLPAQACTYDPTNTCQSAEEIPCDGPEDCPTGKHCCTDLGGGGPTKTACYDSCVALLADASTTPGTWRELCHAGDTCEDSTFQCRTSQFLPSWLTRCNVSGMGNLAPTNLDTSANRVNCGAGICAAGQKCCAVQPASGQPIAYCADKSADCKCHPPDGGTPEPRRDAGTKSPSDAGSKD